MPLPDVDTGATYQALAKANYQNLPPINSTTDWDNTLIAPAFCNVAELTQTAPRFSFRLQLATTTAGLSILDWSAVWGKATTTAPTTARSATGQFTVTVPSTVSDEYNASVGTTNNHTVQFVRAVASFEGSTFGFVNVSAVGNVVTIYTGDHTGAASDMANSIISVWVR